jgi:N-acetylglucosamine transport system substrate-binding protein
MEVMDMRRKIALVSLAIFLVFAMTLAACAKDNSSNQTNNDNVSSNTGNNSSNTPTSSTDKDAEYQNKYPGGINFDKMKDEEHELEVLLVPGYLTDDLWDYFFKRFEEDHPKWKITKNLTPNAVDIFQSRAVSGDLPPFNMTQGLSYEEMIDSGLIIPLDGFFKSKAYDSDKTISEIIMDGFEEANMVDGKPYTLIYRYAAYGVFYNAKMFEEHGWEVPKTWDEFLALCEEIKQKGITPLMFSGSFSPYIANFFMAPTLAALGGGQDFIDRLHDSDPSAMNSDVMRKALERFVELMEKGYFNKEVLGLDHTQSQLEFLLGRSAMLLMGSWLEAEMQDSIPEGFEYKFMALPARTSTSEPLYVPMVPGGFSVTDSKQSLAAQEFLRFFFSNEMMTKYIEEFGEPLVTNTEAMQRADMSKLSVGSKSIADVMNSDEVTYMNWTSAALKGGTFTATPAYEILHKGLQGLIAGNATIDQIMSDMAKAAEIERNKKYLNP